LGKRATGVREVCGPATFEILHLLQQGKMSICATTFLNYFSVLRVGDCRKDSDECNNDQQLNERKAVSDIEWTLLT
jgi:hypothetical protein